MKLILRKLEPDDEIVFFEGLKLFQDMEKSWYTFTWKEGMSFQENLKIMDDNFHGKNILPGFAPNSMLYAFWDGKIVGRSSIRHELNDFNMNVGGNIGYAVAIKYRNQGFATEILRQSLNYCRDILQLKKVLVTCNEDNIASIKTIEKHNGIFENHFYDLEKNIKTRRYWIGLE